MLGRTMRQSGAPSAQRQCGVGVAAAAAAATSAAATAAAAATTTTKTSATIAAAATTTTVTTTTALWQDPEASGAERACSTEGGTDTASCGAQSASSCARLRLPVCPRCVVGPCLRTYMSERGAWMQRARLVHVCALRCSVFFACECVRALRTVWLRSPRWMGRTRVQPALGLVGCVRVRASLSATSHSQSVSRCWLAGWQGSCVTCGCVRVDCLLYADGMQEGATRALSHS